MGKSIARFYGANEFWSKKLKPYLLLVEDDEGLGETIKERLLKEGYKVTWTKTYKSARESFFQFSFDLVILDLRLPDGNGFELAEILRKEKPKLPFLFL